MFEKVIYIANYIIAWGLPFSHFWCYLGGGLVFVAICAQWGKVGKLKQEPLLYWMLFFFLFMLFRNMFSAQPQNGYGIVFAFMAHWMWPFAAGYLLADALKVRRVFTIYFWVLFGIVALSMLAYYGLFWQNFGTFILVGDHLLKGLRHHIGLAAVCTNLALISFSLAAFDNSVAARRRAIYIFCGIFLCLAVVLTGSRAYYIALSIMLTVFTAHFILRSRLYLAGSLILLGGLLFFGSIYHFNARVHGRVVSAALQIAHRKAPEGGLITDGNVHERFDLYRIALMEINDRPFFGFGPGQVTIRKEYFDRAGKSDFLDEQGRPKHGHLHSLYLTVAAETGLIGLGIFLFLLFNVVRALYLKHRNNTGFISALAIGVCFGFIAVAIGDMFDTHLRGPGVAMDLLWLTGLVLGSRTPSIPL